MPYSDPNMRRRYDRKWAAEKKAAFLLSRGCSVCGGFVSLRIFSLVEGVNIRTLKPWTRDVDEGAYRIICAACLKPAKITLPKRVYRKRTPVEAKKPQPVRLANREPPKAAAVAWSLPAPEPGQVERAAALGEKLKADFARSYIFIDDDTQAQPSELFD